MPCLCVIASIRHIFKNNGYKDMCAVVSSYEPSDPSLANAFTGAKKTEEEIKYQLAKEMMGDMKPEDFEEWAKNKFVKEPGKMKLLIVCDKLLTGFDAPSATYLYLDKKVVEHTLFQAICRVNRVNGANKLFGYIIDYRKLFTFIEGAIADYTTAKSEDNPEGEKQWDTADMEGLMKERLAGLKENLENVFEQIALLTEEVAEPKELEDYCAYFCYPSDATEEMQESYIENNIQKRTTLYNSIKKLERIYADLASDIDMVYSEDEARAIFKKVHDYEQLRIALMLRSGDAVDLKVYDAEMRSLIDRYVSADSSETIDDLTQMSFLDIIKREIDGKGDMKNRCGGERGSAEAMGQITRQYINRPKNSNAKLYERLSKRLKTLLDEMRQEKIEYAEFLQKIKEINEELINGGIITDPRINNMAKKALFDNLGEDAEFALSVYETINVAYAQGFRQNTAFQARMKRAIRNRLNGTEYSVDDVWNIVISHREEWI